MKLLAWLNRTNRLFIQTILIVVIFSIPLVVTSLHQPALEVDNLERITLGTGGVQANGSSFHVTTSADGRYASFVSFASNWALDHTEENFLDVFVRDQTADKTVKITYSYDGSVTDYPSLDPIITADGRYVSYFSYASKIVRNDTNGHLWLDQGMDVFLYDMVTKETRRVSLKADGGEIQGNSVGGISPDGNTVYFATDGYVMGESNRGKTALYLRDWRNGVTERISNAINGGYPNAGPGHGDINFDGRYTVYQSDATNAVPGDTNGVTDIFLYDRVTQVTKRINELPGGIQANGRSVKPKISYDGRYIVFLSEASNLVVNDNNGLVDVFLYDSKSDAIRRINLTEDGFQANGLSTDPSVCGDGRFVSYTTEATNLVPDDLNGERDVILHDTLTGRNTVATINESGEWGNGRAHRSQLVPDCQSIVYASDATNLVIGDSNKARDIFIGQIVVPADFSRSFLNKRPAADPGDTLVYSYTVSNIGYETGTATMVSEVPTNTTYIDNSVTGGAIFNSADNQVEWQATIAGGEEYSFSYAVTVEPTLVDPTIILNQSILSGDGQMRTLDGYTIINGWQSYLPVWKFN